MKHLVTLITTGVLAFGVAAAHAEDAKSVTARVAQVKALTWAAWMGLPDTATINGTEIRFEPSGFKSSADVLLAVQTGQVDMGPTALNVVASAFATTENLSIRMVAGVGDGTTTVVIRPESGIETLEDLRDKRIGAVRGSNEFMKLRIALASIGIDLNKDTKLTTLNSPTDEILALQRGDLDAMVTYAPFATQAVKAGGVEAKKITELLQREAGVPTVIIANSDFLAKHPKAVQAAINAYADNWKKFADDPATWVDTYLENGSGDRELLVEAAKGLPAPQWKMKEGAMVRVVGNLAKYKVIPADTSADLVKLLDYSFLEKATGLSAAELGKK